MDMRRITEEWLKKNGFIPYPVYSTPKHKAYKIRFPVYKYDTSVEIQCEIIIWDNRQYTVDVYDGEYGRAKYASWYLGVDCDIVRTINRKINKKLKELGLKKNE